MQTLKETMCTALNQAEKLDETDPADRKRLESVLVYLRRIVTIMECVPTDEPAPEIDPIRFAFETAPPPAEPPAELDDAAFDDEDTRPLAADAATDVDILE
jgi:hypothetical protein